MDQRRRRKYYLSIVFISLSIIFLIDKVYSQSNRNDSLIRKFEQSSNEKEKVKTAIEIANLNYSSDSTLYLKYTLEAQKLCENLGDNFKKGKIYLNLGYFYSERNIFKALEYANKCLTIFKELDSLQFESQAYTLIGTIYYYNGNYSKSFENYFESLKINENLKKDADLAVDYNNLAIIYSAQKNNKQALEYLFKALKINHKYKFLSSYSGNLMNISITYGDMDSINQELKYGKMALDSSRKYGDEEVISHVLLSLGYTYVKIKDFDRAEKYYAEAEDMFLKQGSKYYLNYLYSSKGQLFKEKNNITKAIHYYKLTLENAQKDGISALVQDASLELSKIYKSQNQYKEGLFYHEIYHNISDSISNVEKTKKITELELQYKFDKQMEVKKREEESQHKVMVLQRNLLIFSLIALLLTIGLIILIIVNYKSKHRSYLLLSEQNIQIQKQNEAITKQSDELRIQRDQLKNLNATKDKLYSIIAHDLKNPFNAIIGFTSLIVSNWDDIDSERKKQYISKINESAENAYDLLENLLEWARSQTGKIRVTPECIEIKNHFDETINFIIGNAKAKGITIINMVEPSAAIWADKNMISSVTRNLLSNAIKFTKENGMVKISNEYLANGFINISIEDNGVGMTEDLIANLFNIKTHVSSYGTNNEKGTGLGLLICKEFIEKNNGKITVESQVGKGTKFTITLPSFKKD